MQIDISIKNYRCFSQIHPVKLTLKPGIVCFVGVNNSGKSSLLKFFYELRPVFTSLNEHMNVIRGVFKGDKLEYRPPVEVLDPKELFFNGNEEPIEVEITLPEFEEPQDPTIVNKVIIFVHRDIGRFAARFVKSDVEFDPETVSNADKYQVRDNSLFRSPMGGLIGDFGKIRSALQTISDTYYIPAFRHISSFAPAKGSITTYYDMYVGQPFIQNWHNLQAGRTRSDRESVHGLVEEIKAVFGFRELQIIPSIDDLTLQLNINGRSFSIQELGSGLAQFILILGNAAFRKPAFVLIDEPELNLHPTLQVKFLMKLAGYAREGVLFATHNIGLARSTADAIYSVSTEENGHAVSELNDSPRLAELLGELNYEGYRPLGFSKVLLVEGRTSFKLFVELLRKFNKDHEFLIVPMGDLVNRHSRDELQEVTRICPHTFAIIDSEKNRAADALEEGRQRFMENCRELQIDCLVLEKRAIENYFSENAIRGAVGDQYRALAAYEAWRDAPRWAKSENWKIIRRMEHAEIEATDLGGFLARI